MSRLELYKELYFNELERKEHISSRLQWNISFWVLIFGGMLFCLNNVHKVSTELKVYFYISIFITLISMLISTVFLILCLWGKIVHYVPTPRDMDREYETLVTHYAPYPEYRGEIEIEFEKRVTQVFNESATKIHKINNKTVANILKSTQAMVVAAIVLLLSFAFMLPDFLKGEEPINKIEIINESEIKNNGIYKVIIESEE